tara:strand:- start:196 stop:1128 length:933 start_codon:yes stop_codon:yes gene_type:complete
MIKNIILILFFISSSLNYVSANNNVYIVASINDEIITNYDLQRESEYLKILNPKLNQLNDAQILKIAKTSLVNEIIKKKEIIKRVDLQNNINPFVDDYLKNLYLKLNYKNIDEFKGALLQNNIYNIDQIKDKLNIELYWNDIIYNKYSNQVKIDKESLIQKVENLDNKIQKQFFLSEIVFNKKKDTTLESLSNQIKLSINEIGFNNTANIFSISSSSKLGGKLGWVDQASLSEKIIGELEKIKENEHTDAIQVGNNFLILKIEEIKINKIKINKQEEINKLVQFETNKQLNQFSRIFFDKSKINYSINEK